MPKRDVPCPSEGDSESASASAPPPPPEKKLKSSDEHFKMYKPPMVLCQFVFTARKRRKRKLLGEYHDFPSGTMAIGRLDEDSEGLLLLTTDGKVSDRVRGKTVEKEYHCQVDGQITNEAVNTMKAGLEISVRGTKVQTLPCTARILNCNSTCEGGHPLPGGIPKPVRRIRDSRHGPTSWVSVIVTEGKYRQVKKMTAAVGYPTLRLVRVRIADITLDDMQLGEVRKVDINI
jgi:23S rRNA pseudouridine2457 synthase